MPHLNPNKIDQQKSFLPPVVTMDGPSGTGKGTLSQRLAKHLGWHYLDSGALFRVLAHQALEKGATLEDPETLSSLAEKLHVEFLENENRELTILLDGIDITHATRTEECGNAASKIATIPQVRTALLEKQRTLRRSPGLVTDGRDMGTVVFPDATLKFFLDATIEERAKRRYKQLKKKGLHDSLPLITQQLTMRDKRDSTRSVAPLIAAPDAILIDTTHLDVEQSFNKILEHVKKMGIVPGK